MNKYQSNYIAADPVIEQPRADLIRHGDVIKLIDRTIDVYGQQQRAALQAVQGATVEGRGFLSDAAQVAQRRRTSALYLATYTGVSALTMGGLAFLAHVAAGVDGSLAIGGWMTATGGLTLLLAHLSHLKEFSHSPEGIARLLIDAQENVQLYGLESARVQIELEHEAERARQERAAREAERARQTAIDAEKRRQERIDESARQKREYWAAQAPQATEAAQTHAQRVTHVSAPIVESSPPEQAQEGDSWRSVLAGWMTELYTKEGAISETGTVKIRAPWSARAPWSDTDKAEMKRVALARRPALFETSGNGNLRLRIEVFATIEQAIAILTPRLTDD